MHVLHVITGLGQGGAEAVLEKLLHAGREQDPGVTQQVISLGTLGEVGKRLRDAGFDVHPLGMRRSLRAVSDLLPLARRLRAAPAETIVQTWMYHGDLIGGVIARAVGRRTVVWNLRQSGIGAGNTPARTRVVARFCGAISRLVPAAIVTNSQAAMTSHAPMGYDLRRCVLIPNGFDTRAFFRNEVARTTLRREFGLGDDVVAVGLVARVDPQKDHDTFVAASAIVARELPNARFVLVGRGVLEDAALSRAIAAHGLGERTLRIGQRSDVSAVMNALDVFCLSSRAEGFPNVLGEAMACETPSVTTDAGDARLLLGNDDLVAPTENPAKLADCILRVARLSPDARRDVGRQQRQRVATEYDIAHIWARYRDLYASLL